MHQLFEAQETQTLAMVGVVLACVARRQARQASRSIAEGGSFAIADAHASKSSSIQASRATLQGMGGARPGRQSGLSSDVGSESETRMSSYTWSPDTGLDDLAGSAKRLSQAQKDKNQPWSAENSLIDKFSSMPKLPPSSSAGFPSTSVFAPGPPTPLSSSLPYIRELAFEEQPVDLVPRDAPTLERLLHSAHAHCDLLHRLDLFCASRSVAKLLHVLRAYHELPLLEVERKFGSYTSSPPPGVPVSSVFEDEPMAEWEEREVQVPPAPVCAVCWQRVRGLYMPCCWCGHGSHMACFRQWFTTADQKCPTIGCECRCNS
jgi:hypothetical protein